MNNFQAMKNNRKAQLEKLNGELSKLQQPQGSSGVDTRFWKPETDKAGNGYAVIRFLPAPKNEDVPFVRIWDHGFQGPGGWYIENSLTTLGKDDPVSEYNTTLWNSGIEANKDIVRKQKRRLHFISNIYVVKDPANPANEGKVFLFKYGKKIFDKLNDVMNPQYEDEAPVNPFDLWEGANFKLKIRQVEGYRNYDKSEFDSAGPFVDEDELEGIWNGEHSLQEFLEPKNFKSYTELKAKLERVLGLNGSTSAPSTTKAERDVDEEFDSMNTKSVKSSAPKKEPSAKKDAPPWKEEGSDEDNELEDWFKTLAE
jgi:hypothetical protein